MTSLKKKDLKKNIKEFEKEIMSSLDSKAKMKNKQDNLYIGDALYKIFLKANDIKNTFDDVVISAEHLLYALSYYEVSTNLILTTRKFQDF